MNIQQIKQRFEIIGNSPQLNGAIETALQIAPTNLSVLISGESGTGKEVFSQIIHQNSTRKHNQYISINCGAIPDGTIDSELFGHEKGAFTGAVDSRKGYFEVVNGGTIFLDEVGELPLSTQVRLLRVLENGEYIRVGTSKTQKTDVRIIAATNVDLHSTIEQGKFREDLYYRLNTVPIIIPPLRERKNDIYLLFKKFSNDSCEKYGMPKLNFHENAIELLVKYQWPGNIRQLKNIAEQISVIEKERYITYDIIKSYLPKSYDTRFPALIPKNSEESNYASEREILFKLLFDMKKDMNELKKIVHSIFQDNEQNIHMTHEQAHVLNNFIDEHQEHQEHQEPIHNPQYQRSQHEKIDIEDTHEIIEESLSLAQKEEEFIKKALAKHNGKRKPAAEELGISERTLYRKIKEYNIQE
ncbi:MAG: sigma-54 dependent transcriptional regulator [Bacteroidales bacterium]|jgi:transcriptional regulator with PAS, ATPase and Fis domain|nr:sigma-54 dependent transcriptional regulator [Bacteroidales bacterium]